MMLLIVTMWYYRPPSGDDYRFMVAKTHGFWWWAIVFKSKSEEIIHPSDAENSMHVGRLKETLPPKHRTFEFDAPGYFSWLCEGCKCNMVVLMTFDIDILGTYFSLHFSPWCLVNLTCTSQTFPMSSGLLIIRVQIPITLLMWQYGLGKRNRTLMCLNVCSEIDA